MSDLAGTDVSAAPSTLGIAVSKVPQLRSICSAVLATDVPGSGLKVMRLVCKQLRQVMLREVHGCCLELDGKALDLCEMTLLRGTSMSYLRVNFTAHMDGLNAWTTHAMQLRVFLSEVGAAIRSITRLGINTQSTYSSSASEGTIMLLQLAAACPAMQLLQVSGDIGRGALAAFGAACPNLSCLVLSHELPSHTLQQLHLILPSLTQVRVHPPPSFRQHSLEQPPAGLYFLSLLTCASLTDIDVGYCSLTPEMWHALPNGLRALQCAFGHEVVCFSKTLDNLEHFGCYCQILRNHAEGPSLLAVLHAAPGLQSLNLWGEGRMNTKNPRTHMPTMAMVCWPSILPDLTYLNHRASAALDVISTLSNGEVFCGLYLTLWHQAPPGHDDGRASTQFMASLPQLPAVYGLVLKLFQGIEGAPQDLSTPTFTSFIAAKFPNLTHLTFGHGIGVDMNNLVHLAACKGLQYLCLEHVSVTPMQLARLCSHLVCLKLIELNACEFSEGDGVALERLQKAWGFDTRVIVNSSVQD